MLTYRLVHPPLLGALASLGHGSRVLLADANFPLHTASGPHAHRVFLNVARDLLTVDQVLAVLRDALPLEAAAIMRAVDAPSLEEHYRALLPDGLPLTQVDRFDFYDLARHGDTGLVVATGDSRPYANLMLTVGVA